MKARGLFFCWLLFQRALFSQEEARVPRYATGTFFFENAPRDGLGELTIRNDIQDRDAVAVLTLPDTTIVLALFIKARDSFQIQGIRNGIYHLWFALGEEWDPGEFRFRRNGTYERFESDFEFETSETASSILYSSFVVTLYPVVHGNAPTETVPDILFPKPPR